MYYLWRCTSSEGETQTMAMYALRLGLGKLCVFILPIILFQPIIPVWCTHYSSQVVGLPEVASFPASLSLAQLSF